MKALGAVFDLDRLENASADARGIVDYYRASRHAYSRYNHAGAVHMGLKGDGALDHAAQVRFVADHLPARAANVVELAAGRGMNALWLLSHRAGLTVHALDLSPAQLRYARRSGRGIAGFHPVEGDFHDLSRFAEAGVDAVYVIEALCHSPEPGRVLAEVARILRPGGRFIVVDGYAVRNLPPEIARAVRLTARGMAVPDFTPHADLAGAAQATGFAIRTAEVRTRGLAPTLVRFEHLARRIMGGTIKARVARAVLPRRLIWNAAPAYLLPVLVEMGAVEYRLTVFETVST